MLIVLVCPVSCGVSDEGCELPFRFANSSVLLAIEFLVFVPLFQKNIWIFSLSVRHGIRLGKDFRAECFTWLSGTNVSCRALCAFAH